jgi:hypothetical protein
MNCMKTQDLLFILSKITCLGAIRPPLFIVMRLTYKKIEPELWGNSSGSERTNKIGTNLFAMPIINILSEDAITSLLLRPLNYTP